MIGISFSNLKGGVGKSSLTLETANYFSLQGKNVIVVDCDLGQKTLLKALSYSENPPYDVLEFNLVSQQEAWIALSENLAVYDYVFFDIPGSVYQPGVLTLIEMLDKLIVVTKHTPKDLSATAEFISVLQSHGKNDFKILFNMLRPYRDQDHKQLIEDLKNGSRGVTADILGIDPSFFFEHSFMDEQAAIEKNMEVGFTHKKIIDRYSELFTELETFINS